MAKFPWGRLDDHLLTGLYQWHANMNEIGSGAAASVADGGTISHGLSVTPTVVIATCRTSGEFVSVTARSATTFTCAIKKHDNTAGTTQTIDWIAWA